MNLTKVVAYNTLVQVAGKAITLVFGITTTALLTNYLGPVGFGDYIFSLSFVAIFSSMADWGTMLITVREAARDEKNQGKIFANVLLLRLGLSFLAMVAVWLLIILFPFNSAHPELLRRLVILSSTLIVIFGLKTSLEIIFQTKIKLAQTALVELTASLLTLIFSFLVIKFGGNLYAIIGALCAANFFAVLLAFSLVFRLTDLNFSLSWPVLKRISNEALPMGGILILYSIYNRLDTLILQIYKGSEVVGIYGLSYRIYEVLILGAFYLMSTLLPILSQEKNPDRLKRIYQQTLDILILGGVLVAVGTFFFAPLAIRTIAFKQYQGFNQSIGLLQILGLAAFVGYLNHLTGYALVVLGEQKNYFKIALIALFFNLSFNLFMIPLFSFYAAAWITVLTEVLVFCLTSILVAKTMKFFPSFFSFPKTTWQIITDKGKIFLS